MASSALEPHSADEAGGEAVFTSDGLPSLAVPLPPPPLPSVGGAVDGGGVGHKESDGGGDLVVEEESDPHSAFKAFSNADTCGDGGGWDGISSNTVTPSFSGIDPASWRQQDPRRRLFLMKSELDRLESTLANEEQPQTEGRDEGNENMRAMEMELKSRLAALGVAGDLPSLATMLRGRQEDLSHVIVRDLERFGGGSQEGLAGEMEHLSISRGKSKPGEDRGKIVYELYRAHGTSLAAAAPSSSFTVPRAALLEERLRLLENTMGTSPAELEGKSILERLTEAERLSKEADPKQIEKLVAKAKVVRADLEAAARARVKLTSKSSSSAVAKEDAKTLSALHSQMVELEGIAAHLPALTIRLLELSNLHTSAADFASRLEAAESAVSRSEGTLQGVEQALVRLEGGWRANAELAERNVKRLDELLARAQSS